VGFLIVNWGVLGVGLGLRLNYLTGYLFIRGNLKVLTFRC